MKNALIGIYKKNDSLGTNVCNEIEINGTTTYHYNLRVPVSGDYIIETSKKDKDIDTKLYLYEDDGTLLESNDDGGENLFSRITCNLSNKQDYWVKVSGYSLSNVGKVNLAVKAKNTVYINTYSKNDDIDTRKDSISPRQNLSNNGYYVKHLVNASRLDMLIKDENGLDRFNNPYYMLSSHGSSSGAAVLSPGQYLYGSNLPNMSNVELAVWAICYGGKEGNIAQYCVTNKMAKNSLGFPGLTYVNTSKTFTDKLWEEVSKGTSIIDAVDIAISHTKSTHWFTHMFGWGDDTIINPSLYSANNMEKIKKRTLSQEKILQVLPALSISDEKSLSSFKESNETAAFEFNDSIIIIKTIDSLPTNDYFVINKTNGNISKHLTSSQEQAFSQLSSKNVFKLNLDSNQRITLQNDFNLMINGFNHIIKRVQYVTNVDNYQILNEIYYDINTYECFSEEDILNSFLY